MPTKLVETIIALIGISAVAAISRTILSQERRSLGGFCRATFLAVFVGSITGGILQSYSFTPETQGAIVGLCAFVADDILMMVVNVAAWLRDNPQRLLGAILNRKIDNE